MKETKGMNRLGGDIFNVLHFSHNKRKQVGRHDGSLVECNFLERIIILLEVGEANQGLGENMFLFCTVSHPREGIASVCVNTTAERHKSTNTP